MSRISTALDDMNAPLIRVRPHVVLIGTYLGRAVVGTHDAGEHAWATALRQGLNIRQLPDETDIVFRALHKPMLLRDFVHLLATSFPGGDGPTVEDLLEEGFIEVISSAQTFEDWSAIRMTAVGRSNGAVGPNLWGLANDDLGTTMLVSGGLFWVWTFAALTPNLETAVELVAANLRLDRDDLRATVQLKLPNLVVAGLAAFDTPLG